MLPHCCLRHARLHVYRECTASKSPPLSPIKRWTTRVPRDGNQADRLHAGLPSEQTWKRGYPPYLPSLLPSSTDVTNFFERAQTRDKETRLRLHAQPNIAVTDQVIATDPKRKRSSLEKPLAREVQARRYPPLNRAQGLTCSTYRTYATDYIYIRVLRTEQRALSSNSDISILNFEFQDEEREKRNLYRMKSKSKRRSVNEIQTIRALFVERMNRYKFV